MSKISVLVVPSDRFGSGKFRSVDPHVNLSTDEFHVDINYTPDWNNLDELSKYQIVHLHRHVVPEFFATETIIKRLQGLGCKVVVDTDDYWHLDTHHGNYKMFQQYKLADHMMAGFRAADLVTCPTKFVADELRRIGIKNVVVLPNAINPSEEQFIARPTESEKLRFGWLGGSSHLFDVELLKGIAYAGQPFQTVVCGFDTRGKVTEVNEKTGERRERDISPAETVWFNYEIFATDGYEILKDDKPYLEHLFKFKDEPFAGEESKPYRRIFTRPVNVYAKGYDQFDVSLAPLKDTKFNLYKSQLKVIEAGFKKKALIASEYGPYTIDLVHGKNALLVSTKKNHKQWKQHVNKLVQNPQLAKELGEALYETVKEKYNLNNVNRIRVDLYKNLVK